MVPSARSFGRNRAGSPRLGIGDDAALLAPTVNVELVLSCDAFVEGVHFLADIHPADSVGYKSLARAVSDLAAMGATPQHFLLTLALPASRTGKWLNAFLRGLARAAGELRMLLIGGDTTRSDKVFVSLTVVGKIRPGRAVRRSGARPGDQLYVSGTLGAAALGLLMVKSQPGLARRANRSNLPSPIRAHFYPRVRVALGSWLAQNRVASAMMDISDGLSSDLSRLCAASHVGARIFADRIPCVEIPASLSPKVRATGLDGLRLALHGGEDYELLFAVSPENEAMLRRAPGFKQLVPIGRIERGLKIILVGADGKARPLAAGGWDPFGNE